MIADTGFAAAVLAWFVEHGRHQLPWQRQQTRYRVWVSEIMLQQTQVATVIPYFGRFMTRFPTLASLASATEDEVLAHWSGLGYYARARNLHRSAKTVIDRGDSDLPGNQAALMELPGIGRSTAAAILSLADGEPLPILDGNVKRVLARYFAIPGWPGQSDVLKTLWAHSEAVTAEAERTPARAVFASAFGDPSVRDDASSAYPGSAGKTLVPRSATAAFNQAMMDLGSGVCTRTKPRCTDCPLAAGCAVLASGDPSAFPGRKPKRTLPEKRTLMLILENAAGEWLLQKRPPVGIWGGLWSLPEIASAEALADWLSTAGLSCDVSVGNEVAFARLRHTFSHFHLDIDVWRLTVDIDDPVRLQSEARVWYNGGKLPGGIAAPVQKLLNSRGEVQ